MRLVLSFEILDMVPTGCCNCRAAVGKKTCPDLLAHLLKNMKKYTDMYPKINSEEDFCNAPINSKLFCGADNRPFITNDTLFVKDYCRVTCQNPPGNSYSLIRCFCFPFRSLYFLFETIYHF